MYTPALEQGYYHKNHVNYDLGFRRWYKLKIEHIYEEGVRVPVFRFHGGTYPITSFSGEVALEPTFVYKYIAVKILSNGIITKECIWLKTA